MTTNTIAGLRNALIDAIEVSGYSVSGPTDLREVEHGEPAWVCRAREALAAHAAAVPPIAGKVLLQVDGKANCYNLLRKGDKSNYWNYLLGCVQMNGELLVERQDQIMRLVVDALNALRTD